jgi:hypothetical protein
MQHATRDALDAGLTEVKQAPLDHGTVRLIVRRPAVDQREVLAEAVLDCDEGVVGDTWRIRGSRRTSDGSAHPDMQLNIMNARVAALIAGTDGPWQLAGDQLYLDFDISEANLPPGSRVAIGDATIEFTDQPHTGCAKFAARFGKEALRWVNSSEGRRLRLRGANARVIVAGAVRTGDAVRKLTR